MIRTFVLASLATLAVAACGSKSSSTPATTTPATTAPAPSTATAEPTPTPSTTPPAPEPTPPPPPAPDPAKIKADLLADEQAAFEKAKPVFTQYCAKCHTQTGKAANKKKLGHFDMTSYPFGGHHTATIGNEVREVLGLSGEKATMPNDKPGSVKGDDLATIDAWAQAWIKADQAGAHGEKSGKDKLDSDKD